MRKLRKRSGFTAIEIIMTIGTLAISMGMAVPIYRQYIIRNDLEIARQNVAQGLERAKYLSQVVMNDARWGFSTNEVPGRGVLFMGDSYALRNADFDELYSIPSTVTVSGITEVTFAKITGIPSQTGDIDLQAITGDTRVVTVSLGEEGNVSMSDDWLTICHDPYGTATTMLVSDSLWEVHADHGDTLGECGTISSSSSAGSSSSTSGPGFTITGDTISPSDAFTCIFEVVGTNLTAGGAYDMMITTKNKIQGNDIHMFGNYNNAYTSNINDSGQTFSYNCDDFAANGIDVWAKSWEKKKNWYSGTSNNHWKVLYERHSASGDNSYIETVVDGSAIPSYPALNSASTLQSYVKPYVDLDSGQMTMDPNSALYLYELGTADLNDTDAADFQDLVIKITIIDQ